MKKYELMPTEENLFSTFKNDTISRNKDIFYFINILNLIDNNYVIALDGNWGSGKTFFVKQIKMIIDSLNDNIDVINYEQKLKIKETFLKQTKNITLEFNFEPQLCVYYDAWANDNDEEPILSLIYSIIKEISIDYPMNKEKGLSDYVKIGTEIIQHFSGLPIDTIIDSMKSESFLDDLKQEKELEENIKLFFDKILEERGNRLIIFIDELDRCKPSYAVKLLERLKHYFLNERITFVFSINSLQLNHTIKKYYGDDFDAHKYLDRFFDLRISLPPADLNRYYSIHNFGQENYTYDVISKIVINKYNFQLREISKYIQSLKIAAYKQTHTPISSDYVFLSVNIKNFCLRYILPILIGLKVHNIQKYNNFIEGIDGTPLIEILMSLENLEIHFKPLINTKDVNEENIKQLIEEELNELYNSIFNNNSISGKYNFYFGLKDELLRISNLLSNYTNFNID